MPTRPTDTLRQLHALSQNLWWTWQGLDEVLAASPLASVWARHDGHLNRFLAALTPAQQARLAAHAPTVVAVAALLARFEEEQDPRLPPAFAKAQKARDAGLKVAYLCAEFGLWRHLPIYSGGLGVLAGDHLKSASDLGLPLVGVGLWYGQGFFRQALGAAGQVEHAERPDPALLPMSLATRGGRPVLITLPMAGLKLKARIWRVAVGRVPLLLLDTDFEANPPAGRAITRQLYVGDCHTRLAQEWLLGLGAQAALEALGLAPTTYHLNEGHSGLVAFALLAQALERGLAWRQALAWVRPRLVFTTHTQEEAGHERYDRTLMKTFLLPLARRMGVGVDALLALGAPPGPAGATQFCLTTLCLRLSGKAGGVSQRHGQVARQNWGVLWPGKEEDRVPIGHVTNGVHAPTWLAAPWRRRLDDTLGPAWRNAPPTPSQLAAAIDISDDDLWRERLVHKARALAALAPALWPTPAGQQFPPPADTLVMGFARRFAAYKRADLLFFDEARLARLLGHADRPVTLLFAGKAHPKDEQGKQIISLIQRMARRRGLKGRLWLLENYHLSQAQLLLGAVDVWLNTPQWPREASGTSGMKAVLGGALNLSLLDGWWEEAWASEKGQSPPVGFAFAPPAAASGQAVLRHDATALYRLLEQQVVPLFYRRNGAGTPTGWVKRQRAALVRLGPVYHTHRMVAEYLDRFYLPAHRRQKRAYSQ